MQLWPWNLLKRNDIIVELCRGGAGRRGPWWASRATDVSASLTLTNQLRDAVIISGCLHTSLLTSLLCYAPAQGALSDDAV